MDGRSSERPTPGHDGKRHNYQWLETQRSGALGGSQNKCRKMKYSVPESTIAAGSVSTQPSAILRRVDHCMPEPLAIIVPATPEESTCVVDTGRPRPSAAPIVAIPTSSAAAPL